MNKKTLFFVLITALLLVVVIYLISLCLLSKDHILPIGGQRDVNGCLTAAGYSWDSEIKACVRTWEMNNEDSRKASKKAVSEVSDDQRYGITIEEVSLNTKCTGCFDVKVSNPEYTSLIVHLNNWEVVYIEDPEETRGYTCPKDEGYNCMPQVGGTDDSAVPVPCSGPYHDWIVYNCDTKFSY